MLPTYCFIMPICSLILWLLFKAEAKKKMCIFLLSLCTTSLLSTSELSPSSQIVSSFLQNAKRKKKHLKGFFFFAKCWNNSTRYSINSHPSGSVSLCSVIAVCRPWTNISINMTQCTIDGHKDCKWSNYFYEMQHYGYINFCKNLVYLYDILKRCQNKRKSWHMTDLFRTCCCVIYYGCLFLLKHTVHLEEVHGFTLTPPVQHL